MPTLYVLIGLPGSGKSTWAQKQGLKTVSPDDYDGTLSEVWSRFRRELYQAMSSGQDVIADACHLYRSHRKKTMKLARLYGYRTAAVWFGKVFEERGYGPQSIHALEGNEGFDRYIVPDLTFEGK